MSSNMSTAEQLYKVSSERGDESTFLFDERLPSLPLPSLEATLDKYVESTRPFLSDAELEATKLLVKDFKNSSGAQLHGSLERKAASERNWMDKWWLDYAYLFTREPLLPFQNMGGGPPDAFDKNFWPEDTNWVQRTSLKLCLFAKFWTLLRTETLKPTLNKGAPWAMDQFKRMFNVSRIPGEQKDHLLCFFKSVSEGACGPRHIVVFIRGQIFSFELLDSSENPLTPSDIERQLNSIISRVTSSGPGLAALTTTDRSTWARNRSRLVALSAKNQRNLDIIDKSLIVVSISDQEPDSDRELVLHSLGGDPPNRWADKLSFICYANGKFGGNADHSPFDAIAVGMMNDYVTRSLLELNCRYEPSEPTQNLSQPELLEFELDAELHKQIKDASRLHMDQMSNINFEVKTFRGYGKELLKKVRFHPEAFVQVVLQVAYLRAHGRPGSTYTTATVRKFFRGRTETCRACTLESLEFAKALLDPSSSQNSTVALRQLMSRAIEKFNVLMAEATEARGCDRHLLGLYISALEAGQEPPELFKDVAYGRSGGGGQFELSTSLVGYWKSAGGVPPMRRDGYSVFYAVLDHELMFSLFDYADCPETSSERLFEHLRFVLNEIKSRVLIEEDTTSKG